MLRYFITLSLPKFKKLIRLCLPVTICLSYVSYLPFPHPIVFVCGAKLGKAKTLADRYRTLQARADLSASELAGAYQREKQHLAEASAMREELARAAEQCTAATAAAAAVREKAEHAMAMATREAVDKTRADEAARFLMEVKKLASEHTEVRARASATAEREVSRVRLEAEEARAALASELVSAKEQLAAATARAEAVEHAEAEREKAVGNVKTIRILEEQTMMARRTAEEAQSRLEAMGTEAEAHREKAQTSEGRVAKVGSFFVSEGCPICYKKCRVVPIVWASVTSLQTGL